MLFDLMLLQIALLVLYNDCGLQYQNLHLRYEERT